MRTRLLLCLLILLAADCVAQNPTEDKTRTTNFPVLRNIVNSHIPGAPILSQPQRIDGTAQEIRTEKHGLAYPAFFDWNGDGRKDLLLGEFETGQTGSNIKVYLNNGTDAEPSFTGEYFYATDTKNDTITNYQWCCIGIHPRLVDMDADGYPDILSGQYMPGAISWWKGSDNGFMPRQFIEQEGYAESDDLVMFDPDTKKMTDPSDPRSVNYWNYTSADFADFNGDGLLDLFVGGTGGPRVALNIGTRENPRFGLREYLRYTDGSVLTIGVTEKNGYFRHAGKSYLTPIDWDGDGVLDILLTHEYTDPGHNPVEFLRGVQTSSGLRFEKPVALFTVADAGKAFPGCQPMITVVDYNNDGIMDIVFGISIPTVNGFEAAPEVAWEWAHELGIQTPGKDAGRQIEYSGGVEGTIQRIEAEPQYKGYYMGKLDDYKYLTMRHRGYVFVMYGSENPEKAQPVTMEPVSGSGKTDDSLDKTDCKEPIVFDIHLPEAIATDVELIAEVVFTFSEGWHGYSDDLANTANGFIPTKAEFVFPDGVLVGEQVVSSQSLIYKGEIGFKQIFRVPKKIVKKLRAVPINIKLQWQICDEGMCLPPEVVTIEKTIPCK